MHPIVCRICGFWLPAVMKEIGVISRSLAPLAIPAGCRCLRRGYCTGRRCWSVVLHCAGRCLAAAGWPGRVSRLAVKMYGMTVSVGALIWLGGCVVPTGRAQRRCASVWTKRWRRETCVRGTNGSPAVVLIVGCIIDVWRSVIFAARSVFLYSFSFSGDFILGNKRKHSVYITETVALLTHQSRISYRYCHVIWSVSGCYLEPF